MFVDAAYGNDPTNSRSTTGFDFIFYEGAVVYRSKNKSINALISTKTDIISDVTADKNAMLLRYMIQELGCLHEYNNPIFEDNDTNIGIVDSSITTERTCHIDVRLLAI